MTGSDPMVFLAGRGEVCVTMRPMNTYTQVFSALVLALAGLSAASAQEAGDGDSCVLPGVIMATDPAGDATSSPVTTTELPDPIAADDALLLALAEPASMPGKLVMTLKVAGLAEVPPQIRWVVYFTTSDASQTDTLWYAAMSTANLGDQATPVFEYGNTGTLDAVATSAGTFTKVGDLDAASTFNADGTITLVLDAGLVNVKGGDTLYNVYAKVRRSTPAETDNIGLTADETSAGDYAVVGSACSGKSASAGKSTSAMSAGALSLPMLLGIGLFGLRRRR